MKPPARVTGAMAAVLVSIGLAGSVAAQTDFRGMSLFGFGSLLGNPDLRESLYDMKTLSVDTVALNVTWKQDDKFSNAIYEDVGGMSASMPQIEHAIDLIHELGMRVLLKPNVDAGDGTWRALFQP